MNKVELPQIVETAIRRPLSYNPQTDKFIYYGDVCNGKIKIVPIEKLNAEQQLKLVIERQITNEPSTTVVLNGQKYTNEQIVAEMQNNTKIGKQLVEADINYLKYYLSSFPEQCFEKYIEE